MTEHARAIDSNNSSTDSCRGSGRVDAIVQSLNGWTLLFIGAITMVGTERIVEEFLSVSGAAEAALTGVVALVLLYAQLAVAYYGRRLLR